MKTSQLPGMSFPVVLTPESLRADFYTDIANSKQEIRELLSQHGAILFRDFPIDSVDAFEKLVVASTSDQWVEYLEATSPRDHVKSNTSTSTSYQKDQTIFFHNEKSYSGVWPLNLFFYCDVPPPVGGETPIADCRAIYRDIPADILEKFERKKLMYVRRFSNNLGIPWKKAFNVETREQLAEYCKANYINDLTWNDDGTPVLKYVRNTSVQHPLTGDKCWFNHGTFFNVYSLDSEIRDFFLSTFGQEGLPYNTYYGDGEDIEEEVIYVLRALYEKHSAAFRWQQGDVLLIDNILFAHGRRPFEGDRNILVTMTESVDYGSVVSF